MRARAAVAVAVAAVGKHGGRRCDLSAGRPPFYTNSIFSLITLIVREPVEYPAEMGAELRSFLEGLLEKDPSRRLTWPGLLEHPFIRAAVAERRRQEKDGLVGGQDTRAVHSTSPPGHRARIPPGCPAPREVSRFPGIRQIY